MIKTASFMCFLALAASAETAQKEPQWSKAIYRLEASGCPGGDRVSTGFKVAGEAGVIASLHGVVGCKDFKFISPNGVNRISDAPKLASVNVQSDLAFLTSPSIARFKDYGIEIGRIEDVKSGDFFSVPGYAYSLVSTMESTLTATHDSASKPLKEFLPADIRDIYIHRKSPSIEVNGIRLQGPLARGQSGAPILNNKYQVIAVVEGGAGENSSDYVWGIRMPALSAGASVSDGPGWKAYNPSDGDIKNLNAISSNADAYFAATDKTAQIVALESVFVKASGHFVLHPDWSLFVDVDEKPSFSFLHNREHAKNILKGQLGRIKMVGDELTESAAGASTAVFTSCTAGVHIKITASIKDNITNRIISGTENVPCNRAGENSNAIVDVRSHTGIFTFERFVLHFSTSALGARP